jgi:hypothetical protein
MRTRGTGRAVRLAWTLCIPSLGLVAGSILPAHVSLWPREMGR